jgi:hypothetical protein
MFPDVRAAVARIIPPEQLRRIAFGHYESDECGAMNEWLSVARIMHGSSFAGDGAAALHALANDYHRRVRLALG